MKKESLDQYYSAKIFNYAMHSFVILIFFLYDNTLKLEYSVGNFGYLITFFILMLLEIVVWERAGIDPGFISQEKILNYHRQNSQDIENSVLFSESLQNTNQSFCQ